MSTKVGSIHNSEDRKLAAKLISDGEIVGVFNRGVNALWINGDDLKSVSKINHIKGEKRIGRPIALTIGFENLIKMIDLKKLSKDVLRFLKFSRNLKKELGSLCFLRVPIKKAYAWELPVSALHVDDKGTIWLQNWDPHGHDSSEKLISDAQKRGVKFPAVTSMNISGEPEIVDQDKAEEFCRKNSITCYLRDPDVHPELVGSYTIITFSKKGIELTRDGNIPGKIIEPIFKNKLISDNTKKSNYPQRDFPLHLIEKLNSSGIRIAILLYLEGKDPLEINRKLRQTKEYTD